MTMLSVLRDILREEGIMGWYSGFAATMLNTFSTQYAYFFFYSFIRTAYTKRLTSKLPQGSKPPPLSTAAGTYPRGHRRRALSDFHNSRFCHCYSPTNWNVLGDDGSQPYELDAPTLSDGEAKELQEIQDDNSFLHPSMVLTVNPAITYGMYERLKSILLLAREKAGAGEKMTPWMSFMLGAFSKTLATIVTYPYIMAKVRIQARMSGSDSDEDVGRDDRTGDVEKRLEGSAQKHPRGRAKQSGALALLIRVLKTEGVVGWYQGMSAQIIKAVLSQALLFVSKEQFERWALVIFVLSSKLRSRS
ncbi:mitochondrial carrier [Pisolithus sp. B1]|nr:mitochondrial carrier [Pisolithus sp. B1]